MHSAIEVFVPDIAANNLHTHVISQAVHSRSNGVQTGHSAYVQIDPNSKLSSDDEHHSVPSLMNTTRCLTPTTLAIMVMLDPLKPS